MMSRITRSGCSADTFSIASSPPAAHTTWKPSPSRLWLTTVRMSSSSSTTRIVWVACARGEGVCALGTGVLLDVDGAAVDGERAASIPFGKVLHLGGHGGGFHLRGEVMGRRTGHSHRQRQQRVIAGPAGAVD